MVRGEGLGVVGGEVGNGELVCAGEGRRSRRRGVGMCFGKRGGGRYKKQKNFF